MRMGVRLVLFASQELRRLPLDTLIALRALPGRFQPDTKRPSANLVGLGITPVPLVLQFVRNAMPGLTRPLLVPLVVLFAKVGSTVIVPRNVKPVNTVTLVLRNAVFAYLLRYLVVELPDAAFVVLERFRMMRGRTASTV